MSIEEAAVGMNLKKSILTKLIFFCLVTQNKNKQCECTFGNC